ncbi:MAG: carbohydrate kinase family protein [Candidatus Pacebacteria bacterium]|nr:carbohydrate kinase family protein [Candidatus Paceibacterota bacterium]
MYDIITFGSATWDNFLQLKKDNYKISQENIFGGNRGLCLPLGAKVFLEDKQSKSGGGGTNSAVTFARQGFRVAYCGKIGDDIAGENILRELKENKVDQNLCLKDKEHSTAYSAILSVPEEERTVLIYRGACHFLTEQDLPKEKLKRTKWFYIAPLSGDSALVFAGILDLARDNKIKVAANLGNTQINLGRERLKSLLQLVDVLILNQEEAASLSGLSIKQEREIILELSNLTNGLIVITKGAGGSLVVAGQDIYEAGIISTSIIEKTGAGDAYASGFLAGLIRKNNIEYAMQLATANATGCSQQIGAKNGLLDKNDLGQWPKVIVNKKPLN